MSLLFEIWVFSHLNRKSPGRYLFQYEAGDKSKIDILDIIYKVIIDYKYKIKYGKQVPEGEVYLEDVRQLSAYARETKTREKLFGKPPSDDKNQMLECLIIYPGFDALGDTESTEELVQCNKYACFKTEHRRVPILRD